MRAILHLAEEQVLSESFIVERREAGLFVELRSAESASIGERLLPSDGTCEELAQAAAVVLSAWLSDVHPDFAPELPAEPVALPPAVVASPLVEPSQRPAENRASQPTAARQAATSPRRVELDLGIGVGVSDGALAGVGSLSGAYAPKGGWGVRATVLVDTTRRAALGFGFPLSAAPAQSSRFVLEASSLEVALTALRGGAPERALAALDRHLREFAGGALELEARVARVDALLLLRRRDEARQELSTLPLERAGRKQELRLIRAELEAERDCRRALVDFRALSAQALPTPWAERALFGRGACSRKLGDEAAAARDFALYLERYPNGRFAGQLRAERGR